MTTLSLQERIAQTKTGGVLDLGHETIQLALPNPNAKSVLNPIRKMKIVGEGATIIAAKGLKERNLPTMLNQATGLELRGDVTLIHDNTPEVGDQDLEGQHAIECRAAKDFYCEWKIENAVANSLYFGRDLRTQEPCRNITITGTSTNAGRQHIALQAVVGFHIYNMTLDGLVGPHSSVAYEPNGHYDVCQQGLIENITYRGKTGPCFSAGSEYAHQPNYAFGYVTMNHCHSADGPFMILLHPSGLATNRVGPFTADDIRGSSVANVSQVRAWRTDHLRVTNYHQRTTARLDEFHDCPNSVFTLSA